MTIGITDFLPAMGLMLIFALTVLLLLVRYNKKKR